MGKLLENGYHIGDEVKYHSNHDDKDHHGIVVEYKGEDGWDGHWQNNKTSVWSHWNDHIGGGISYMLVEDVVLVKAAGDNVVPPMKTFTYIRVLDGVKTKVTRQFKDQITFMRCLNHWNSHALNGTKVYTEQDHFNIWAEGVVGNAIKQEVVG